nr:hypothetical protein [Tanacetum cinerariifolium]
MSAGHLARVIEAIALSVLAFCKRDEDIEEDESLDANDERERERERSNDEGHGSGDAGHGLDDEGRGLEGEGLGLEEEAAPEDLEDDRVYIDISVYPPVAPVQTPLSPEWSSSSLPVSLSSHVVPSPIASPVATLS